MKAPAIITFPCSCGRLIASIPDNAKFSVDPDFGGWYFNCLCGTTIFIGLESSRIIK